MNRASLIYRKVWTNTDIRRLWWMATTVVRTRAVFTQLWRLPRLLNKVNTAWKKAKQMMSRNQSATPGSTNSHPTMTTTWTRRQVSSFQPTGTSVIPTSNSRASVTCEKWADRRPIFSQIHSKSVTFNRPKLNARFLSRLKLRSFLTVFVQPTGTHWTARLYRRTNRPSEDSKVLLKMPKCKWIFQLERTWEFRLICTTRTTTCRSPCILPKLSKRQENSATLTTLKLSLNQTKRALNASLKAIATLHLHSTSPISRTRAKTQEFNLAINKCWRASKWYRCRKSSRSKTRQKSSLTAWRSSTNATSRSSLASAI